MEEFRSILRSFSLERLHSTTHLVLKRHAERSILCVWLHGTSNLVTFVHLQESSFLQVDHNISTIIHKQSPQRNVHQLLHRMLNTRHRKPKHIRRFLRPQALTLIRLPLPSIRLITAVHNSGAHDLNRNGCDKYCVRRADSVTVSWAARWSWAALDFLGPCLRKRLERRELISRTFRTTRFLCVESWLINVRHCLA
jgi:hypothetical protein